MTTKLRALGRIQLFYNYSVPISNLYSFVLYDSSISCRKYAEDSKTNDKFSYWI